MYKRYRRDLVHAIEDERWWLECYAARGLEAIHEFDERIKIEIMEVWR